MINSIATARLNELDKLQGLASTSISRGAASVGNLGNVNSIFNIGMQNTNGFRAQINQNTSIFDIAKSMNTQADSAQSSTTQKVGADASSSIIAGLDNLFNAAQTSFNAVVSMVQDAINAMSADSSPLATPPTTGETVKPEDNIPLDNKGSDNKAASPDDSNPDVKEETELKPNNTPGEVKEPEVEPEVEPETTNEADSSSEIDKAEVDNQEQKRLEEERKKAEEEARRNAAAA